MNTHTAAALDKLSLGFSYLILLASMVMLGWGVLGFLEFFTSLAPLMPLQNPSFPTGTQCVHWLVITAAGGTYLLGYGLRWTYTPVAMLALFASLATLCAVETFDFMQNPGRYGDFVRECIYYVVIATYLFRSTRMQERFGFPGRPG